MSKRYSNYHSPASLSPNNSENRPEQMTHSPKKSHYKSYNNNYHYQQHQQNNQSHHKKYKSGSNVMNEVSTNRNAGEKVDQQQQQQQTVPSENVEKVVPVSEQCINEDESVLSTPTPSMMDESKVTASELAEDQTVAEEQQQEQQEQTIPAQITPVQYTTIYPATSEAAAYDYSNAVPTGGMPMVQTQASPSSYYIYHHSPPNGPNATGEGYYPSAASYPCATSYVYDPNQPMGGYITSAQVPQQAQQTILSSPQPQSTMLTALTSASYQTPPQTSQNSQLYLTTTTTPDANSASPAKINNLQFPYLVPFPTPNSTSYQTAPTPNGPMMPTHLTPMQTPTSFMMYQGPVHTPPAPSTPYMTPRRTWGNNNPRYNGRYNNRNNRYNNRNNLELTPTKCTDSTAAQLTCITGDNEQQMMSPPTGSGGGGGGSPMIFSPAVHCCPPDANYYMSPAVPTAATAAHMISYDQTNSYHAFYPTTVSSDYELMNTASQSVHECHATLGSTSVDDLSATLAAAAAAGEYDTYGGEDELKDDLDNDKETEQLACYVCRGRRMCFCYFLKVRYYKFPSFLDLVDHQYKKWRSNMVKTRKSQQ